MCHNVVLLCCNNKAINFNMIIDGSLCISCNARHDVTTSHVVIVVLSYYNNTTATLMCNRILKTLRTEALNETDLSYTVVKINDNI